MLGWLRKSATYSVSQIASMAGWIGWGTSSGETINERSALDVTAVFCGARPEAVRDGSP